MTGRCEDNGSIPKKKNDWSMYKQLKCSEKKQAGSCEFNRSILKKRLAGRCETNRSVS